MAQVFISGFPYDTDQDKIQEFFKDIGEIIDFNLPKYQDTGRLRGFGHITFATQEEANEALTLDHQYLGKRYLDVKLPEFKEAPKKINPYDIGKDILTLFVKNLPYDANEDEVGTFFSDKCGQVENVRFVYNSVQKHFKGFAYIDFKFNSSVKKAFKYEELEFNDRKLFIDIDDKEKSRKQGFKLKQIGDGNEKFTKEIQAIQSQKIFKNKKYEINSKKKNFNKNDSFITASNKQKQ